ncbi:MAG: 3-isopropylmalate dehydratase small subunit [Actinobacteria bacterium TMED172]|nr:3-isopropylmalate dehydratase small subunit [Cellvibrionales bacterium]OUW33394.1 MAG: 3-isopropylmalate dehydratase small subunit [Actinobacteria bacterium TMED172]|tara:strand:+ start:6877 stop:7515 length:639 start_codon:yes stop_codon:yes gene_type:complete
MRAFTALEGVVMPINRANVDTDMIIPKQFLKSIKRSGFGPYLFDELRYLDKGEPDMDCTHRPLNMDFSLNHRRYAGANILLSRQNFGCGSSREHAPWALDDFGFRCLIAPSFADIFFNNCFKNGILPIQLSDDIVDQLFDLVTATEGFSLAVDLLSQTITLPDGSSLVFEVDSFRKHCLLNGLDDIALTLEEADKIRAFEVLHKQKTPWLYR